jgi:hypothetical protein
MTFPLEGSVFRVGLPSKADLNTGVFDTAKGQNSSQSLAIALAEC